ncbi:SDR family NAD(P)-dependent oxidoreductase [Actinacidiphila bryophytorum]|uniref:3-oxoacyl-(Acyl-carrier protein) reductase n=1 Tax=Actinacidiphila bryophytorum TaxID=1436133 RepID=A0A9W4H1Q9_9ACTN|nr:SDR family oxidoreductase [Actinacidiphila bryophytorum]MBM9435162.1 SDR family oxidoreductase [Actinacidiphila bryophytorum]MBN6541543.1 SDR family oxidoreductase [Actinacidiphila bryophytorum]CAG7643483.1 3-oxoacyl-(acyl-carrier protein) reductase [Actinacidiphila bryophytorum]
MPSPLKGRTALVTGATGGLGTAIARRLAADGAAVVLAHLDDWDAATALAEEIAADGGTARPVEADLRDPDAVRLLCQQAHARPSPVDILVSNAGAYPRTSWADTTPAVWEEMLATNLTSHYLLAHELTPGMATRGWGRIITIGSVLATAGRHDLSVYISAKAGLEGLTRALARELGPADITVNCVAPGSIAVPAEAAVVPDPEAMTTRQLARQCVQRRGRPSDVAAAVAFLATPDAGFISGQTLRVDGGWILG